MQQCKLRWLAYMELEASPKRGISYSEIDDWSGICITFKFVPILGVEVPHSGWQRINFISLSVQVISSINFDGNDTVKKPYNVIYKKYGRLPGSSRG
jgi:hypothetical protein